MLEKLTLTIEGRDRSDIQMWLDHIMSLINHFEEGGSNEGNDSVSDAFRFAIEDISEPSLSWNHLSEKEEHW